MQTDRPSGVRLERRENGVVWLWLDRAERHNAFDADMIAALHGAATDLAQDNTVRAVVLAAEGRSFCAGADLNWMRAQAAADRPTKIAGARALADMLGALDHLPKPLIGRVQGNAYGGGLGLVAVCDVVVAVADARFAFTETRLGLVPATIGPYAIRRLGEGNARRVFLNARPFLAEEARSLGLVARLAEADTLDQAVDEELAWFLDCAPGAVAAAKALALDLARGVPADPVAYSVAALADRWETAEARSGIEAFLARQPMPWLAPAKAGRQ